MKYKKKKNSIQKKAGKDENGNNKTGGTNRKQIIRK